jgi:DNA (cytosine-5)-methyltransferase 1
MFRIIKTVRPTWVIGENVINHENMGLKVVISDLESEGYEVRAFIIPNAACELPTVERHIWVVAATSSIRLKRGETIAYQDNRDKRQFQGTDTRNERRWYLSESRVCRVRQGLPFQMDRVKALGNAVSPQVVEVIGRFIMEIETKGVKYV